MKDKKIGTPITRTGFKSLCKALNIHCTEIMSFEAVIHCRGAKMEEADPEDFDFDKLVSYLDYKSKIQPPADNPRVNVKKQRNLMGAYSTGPASHLPALRPNSKNYDTQRAFIRS
jgi:hypothetical protein